ncbi:MAG: MCE family protein, partial [Marmoricola sp.]
VDRTRARVTFSVVDSTAVTRSSTATIRYRNLVGQRYISVTQGVGDTSRLPKDGTIPLSRTQPALDLTVLFNGFKPLFAALTPADVNRLSYEIIQVFQGEGGNLEGLLRSTGSVTNTLADRDQLIGDVINNLNSVLKTVGDRDGQLDSLIVNLRTFVGGLTQDKDAILNSLDSISALTEQTADLTTGIRPGLVASIKGLRRVATNLNKGRDEIDRALQILPIKLNKIGRTAIYGSFFNFYLCEFQAKVVLPTGTIKVPYETYPGGNGRCNLK